MTWTYSDWRSYPDSNPSAKLAQLRLHIQEVSDAITADVSKHGSSRSSSSLTTYFDRLEEQEKKWAEIVRQHGGSRAILVNFNGSGG